MPPSTDASATSPLAFVSSCLELAATATVRSDDELLLIAAKRGDVAEVERLLSRKANVHVKDETGNTPLLLAGVWVVRTGGRAMRQATPSEFVVG